MANLDELMAHVSTVSAPLAQQFLNLARSDGLRPWSFKQKELLPVVQGGMGVCVSAGSLAGTVAGLGAMGTISAVDLRRLHPDLMAQTARLDKEPDARERIDKANLVALDREIVRARSLAQGRGMVAVNVMRALSAYEAYVMQALQSGADAVVVGAGLPLDLPELAKDFPDTALVPILSDARGVGNGWLLPAGPLREPAWRRADFYVRSKAPGISPEKIAMAVAVTMAATAGTGVASFSAARRRAEDTTPKRIRP